MIRKVYFLPFTENRKDSGSNAHNFGLLIKNQLWENL